MSEAQTKSDRGRDRKVSEQYRENWSHADKASHETDRDDDGGSSLINLSLATHEPTLVHMTNTSF